MPNAKHPISQPDAPSMTLATKGNMQGAQGAACLAWPWDRPATTVYHDECIMPPGHHDGSNLSQPDAVLLSERAAKILQGLPEDWVLSAKTRTGRWSMLGQLMPPSLAEAVARSIVVQMAAARRAA
jgi:site-specific DNA-cytosine methylase